MSTSFPTGLDAMTTLIDNVDQILAAHQNDRADAIEAIETKIGIDSSAINTTLDYFLKHASGAYRMHFHDGSSDDGAKLDWDTCWTDAVHDHSSDTEGGTPVDYTRTKSGDWITSTVTTARTGWTNVSATYSNKFMRINATPLTTGGADTHSHTGPSHTHGVLAAYNIWGASTNEEGKLASSGAASATSNPATQAAGTEATSTSDNVPAYVQVVIFQKD